MSETPAPRFPEAEPCFVSDERTSHGHMLASDWYVAGDPDNARIAAHARMVFHRFKQALAEDEKNCQDLLRSAVPGLSDKAHLLPPVRVDYGDGIAVGEGTFVNYGLVALDVARISIGAHCQIGPSVQLFTPVHPLEPTSRACSLETADPITIGDSAWLDDGTIVYPGVTVRGNCVTGAGSVVIKDIPANSLAVDNPARVLRQLDNSTFDPRHQHPPQETPR